MSDDFRPTASWDVLRRRAAMLREVRAFFDTRGFIEVETPLLSADVVVDRHLDPFETTLEAGEPRRLFLQTSPEFAMKRLIASGDTEGAPRAIYQLTRAFRQGEIGPRHNPEFTIVEWYRRGDDYSEGMKLLSDLCEMALARGPAERLTYRDAFLRHARVNPFRDNVIALEMV